jgi:hypothetical protein
MALNPHFKDPQNEAKTLGAIKHGMMKLLRY